MHHRPRLALIVLSFLLVPSALAANTSCLNVKMSPVPNVDMDRVRKTWLTWNNRLRTRQKLPLYRLNDYLNQTASNWSTYALQRGFIDHKRTPGSSYYDYAGIERWFGQKGLQFANVHKVTFTENIGWGPYRCTSGDCTQALIRAMRSTYSMYVAERTKKSKAHYNSMMNAEFKEIGVGMTVDPVAKRYYLTVHYGTKVTVSDRSACAENAQ